MNSEEKKNKGATMTKHEIYRVLMGKSLRIGPKVEDISWVTGIGSVRGSSFTTRFEPYESGVKVDIDSWEGIHVKKFATDSWEGIHVTPPNQMEQATQLTLFQQTSVVHEEHERTRKHISDHFDEMKTELASKEELLKTKVQIIQTIKEESQAIQKRLELQINDLQGNLLRFVPHKRAFKTSLYFTAFFLGSILCPIIFDIPVMQPLWAWLGLSISAAFLIMSYFMFLEWGKKISSG